MKTVVGLFDNFSDAQAVVNDLEAAGFDRGQINLISNRTGSGIRGVNDTAAAADTTTGTGGRVAHGVGGLVGGAVEGGIIGGLTGLVASLVALAIPGIGPIFALGPLAATLTGAGWGALGGGVIGALTGLGIPKEEAGHYMEGVRRGGTLVTAQVPDNRMQEALDIFNRHNPADIEQRAAHYQRTGYSGYQENAPVYTEEQIAAERRNWATMAAPAAATAAAATTTATTTTRNTTADRNTQPAMDRTVQAGETVTVPVVEEELAVGKRQVQRGGARIHTYVTERPVEENVTLREEHVNVERHPVDRPVTDADMNNAFQNRTIDVTERAEEAVVAKQAHVVEEVVINKEATERQQTVRDTVRRTDVEVDELNQGDTSVMNGGMATGAGMSFDSMASDLRNNFNTNYGSQSQYTYDQYLPAYRYGYDLANDPRYRSMSDWNMVEAQARRDWDARNIGPYERFKDAIRYGWERTRNAARNTANAVTGR